MASVTCAEAELPLINAIDFSGDLSVLTGAQIRAARALLRWRVADLSERSGISIAAIQRAEAVDGTPHMQVRNLAAIKTAFEKTGLIFLGDGDYSGRGGPGVRQPVRRLQVGPRS